MNDDRDTSQKRPLTSFVWPGVFVLVAALAYFGRSSPLETARPKPGGPYKPPGPPTTAEIPAVYSRLWDDPLAAAYRDRQAEPEPAALATRSADWLSGWPYTKMAEKCRRAKPDPELQKQFAELMGDSKEDLPLLVMPVLVRGGPYAEDREWRMRTRYAVLAALMRSGYKLSLPTRMSSVSVPISAWLEVVQRPVPVDLVVPVKVYRKESLAGEPSAVLYPRVLVLWVNEGQLGDHPLDAIAQLLNQLFAKPKRDNLRVRIIGPTSSDTLLAMHKEALARRTKGGCGFQPICGTPVIYSQRATVWEGFLPDIVDGSDPRFDLSGYGGLKLVRAIGSDRLLVSALREELQRRGAWPDSRHPDNHVVLVTERDTLYGRTLPEIFRRQIGEPDAGLEGNLHVLTYLRGIDGAVPAGGEACPQENGESKSRNGEKGDDRERPEGRSQLDYLRRMERQLVGLDRQLRRLGTGRIAAVGVVGGDFYDKLLVLRAIRGRFRRAWFFTTDVDAGYAHPDEYDSARNLLVASHFALQLHDKLQGDVPPFRNSYQTSTFLAVLLALEAEATRRYLSGIDLKSPWGPGEPSNGEERARHLEPLVFEIGRHGPYQLTVTEGLTSEQLRRWDDCPPPAIPLSATARVQPVSPRQRPWYFLPERPWLVSVGKIFLLVAALALILVVVAKNNSWTCKLMIGILAALRRVAVGVPVVLLVLLLVGLIVFDDRRAGGEPFELLEGISVWPSTLLRLLAAVLGVVFLVFGYRDLVANQKEIERDLLGLPPQPQPDPPGGSPPSDAKSPWQTVSGVFGRLWPALRCRGEDASEDEGGSVEIRQRWNEYVLRGRAGERAQRIAVMCAGYLLFALCLFGVGGFPNRPYRGQVSLWLGQIVLVAAVLSMIVLIFFVLDASALCRRLVRRLGREAGPWTEEGIARTKEKRGETHKEDLRELLAIRLIALRTRVVGKLMYYPCIVVALVVLSRHPAFDYWDYPWPLILLSSAALLSAVLCAVVLAVESGKARREVLGRLDDNLSAAVAGKETLSGPRNTKAARDASRRVEQIKLIREEIAQEQRGAFNPLSKNPIFNALAVPATGLVIIYQFMGWL